ncbi:MAG: DmsE family decaheme c-type cytochrome [Gammaproteobacteria bacterium]
MNAAGAGVVLALVLAGAPAVAGAQAPEPEAFSPSSFATKGADTCLKCHDEDSKFPVMDIFKTPHGARADARTPFGAGATQCESCHGAGGEHARKKKVDEPQGPIGTFGTDAKTPPEVQDRACLACHSGAARHAWAGSEHESAGIPCAGCHVVHAAADPVRATATQAEACGGCHARERAASLGAFAHPLRDRRMACSDCHSAHGSAGDALLAKGTVNDTCFTCHADKRGPFLWEHAPAAEDCSLCHASHGSPHRALLVQRAPLLCQGCHAQAGHPSLALGPDRLAAGSPSAFLLGGSCANCHSQVHGSNHPSGADLGR